MTISSKPVGKKAKTKKRIFEIAMELFLRQGYEATTIEQIVIQADVAKGTFFNHFPTKDAILSDLGRQRMEMAQGKLAEKLGYFNGSTEKIFCLMKVFGQMNEESREITALVMREMLGKLLSGFEQEKDNQQQLKQVLMQLIQDGQKSGEFASTVDAGQVADILLATYFFTLSWWLEGELTDSLTEDLLQKAKIIIAGIKGPKSIKNI